MIKDVCCSDFAAIIFYTSDLRGSWESNTNEEDVIHFSASKASPPHQPAVLDFFISKIKIDYISISGSRYTASLYFNAVSDTVAAPSGFPFPSARIPPDGHSLDLQHVWNVRFLRESYSYWGEFTATENKKTRMPCRKDGIYWLRSKFSSLLVSDFHYWSCG